MFLIFILIFALSENSYGSYYLDCQDVCLSRYKAYELSQKKEDDINLRQFCVNKDKYFKAENLLLKQKYINNDSINSSAFMNIFCRKKRVEKPDKCVKRLCPEYLDNFIDRTD